MRSNTTPEWYDICFCARQRGQRPRGDCRYAAGFRLTLRTPGVEVTLEALQDVGEDHPGRGDDDEPGEHLVALERRARDRHEVAHTGARRDQLAHDDTDQSVADPEAQPGEDERHGARQCDSTEELQVARAEGAGDADQMAIEVPHAGRRVDD